MSEELKDIKENIMSQINNGKIKMKPKIYFILGSISTFIGLISSIVISIFLFGLVRFSLRTHGPMGQYKFDQMLSYFPWWTVVLAIFSLILGIWLIHKYDFSYKIKPWIIILIFILAIATVGIFIDIIGFNDILFRYGPMKGIMGNGYLRGPL
ncbi:hypothetical protein CO033_03240 [Candidatus Nomurabacteria bacterium CG_4_9_14_0_2_um_filter_32_10]|uniref:Uncharacterized protein n=3 Tax=Candidatus Nomuraibacteriota TaxID=1752729 RepID=A0A2H0CHE2_9BACT|nr:MAG: hypothetical protein COW91_00725 [Candidatus Nomurabacteria bacterium CG22_combo_CG10-13_8_21_14_all_32_8]PIZ86262.1 MAG: hypothetical protein COX94_00610 [Candidatus Nomurabacteria bacterium CG_4_10_14_0_2_um_filter_33_9]PJC49122.1 MAG: hypothetical protein CO033_03240 [Candidatus Nomurabacteria bacterium CG_4_9_14_0_2_um_filter_32_10]